MYTFYQEYGELIHNCFSEIPFETVDKIASHLRAVKTNSSGVFIFGNGGSASIAKHVAVDLMKNFHVNIKSNLSPEVITCFANDFGFENWIAKQIEISATPGDLVILISSSGESLNLINAAKVANKKSLDVVTLTGFNQNNPLSQLGNHNIWINNRMYNIVETVHQMILLAVCDFLIMNP